MGIISKILGLTSRSDGDESKKEEESLDTKKSEDNKLDGSQDSEKKDITVLVVDDEREVADMYSTWLEDEYKEVKTAYGGEKALEYIGNGVDLIFLDRRMPDVSGDEVLEEIREDGVECQVSMLTAVDPDFDIVEMEFDHYITKPVRMKELKDEAEKLVERMDMTEEEREEQTLGLKKKILDDHKNRDEKQESEEYDELLDEMDDKEIKDEELDGFFS